MSKNTYINQLNSLRTNIKRQLWQTKIIEFFSHATYQDTHINNILTMRDVDLDGSFTSVYDFRGKFIERYSLDSPSGNSTAHSEGMTLAGLVWLTDYIEVGPADMFEYINGIFMGSQLAKTELGLVPVCMDIPITLAQCMLGYRQSKGLIVPDWMDNSTRCLSHPAFKGFWFGLLFVLGSLVSVFTQLLKTCTWATVFGGFASTAISLLSSSLVGLLWQGIDRASAETLWMTHDPGHWSVYADGDQHMGGRIALYRSSTWFYNLGAPLHLDLWFFEVFYLSTYFPDLGFWSGPFDSLLPFVVLVSGGFLLGSGGLALSFMGAAATVNAIILSTNPPHNKMNISIG